MFSWRNLKLNKLLKREQLLKTWTKNCDQIFIPEQFFFNYEQFLEKWIYCMVNKISEKLWTKFDSRKIFSNYNIHFYKTY